MKRYTSFILILFAIIGLLTLSSCKRAAVDDPKVIGPAGYRVTVSGKIEPATLHVPQGDSPAYALVTVKVTDNAAKPVANKSVLFEGAIYDDLDAGKKYNVGYFTDSSTSKVYKATDVRTTDSNGMAQIYFVVISNTPINKTIVTSITCTLLDDGRNDNSVAKPFDTIPITIIPYIQNGVYISGKVTLENTTPLEGLSVTLSDASNNSTATSITRADGSYGFYVNSGWYGKITPPANSGYEFMPTQYVFYSGITADTPDINFVVASQSQLSVNATHLTAKGGGGESTISITNGLSTAPIDFKVTTTSAWLSFDKIVGVTPTTLKITSAMNPITTARTGKVILTANSSSVKNSPIEITVSQEGGPSLIADPNPVYIGASFLGDTPVQIMNGSSSDVLHWSASTSTTWLTYSPAGSTTGSAITIRAQTENHTGFTREGYILIQAYNEKDEILEGVTATIRVIQASTSPRQK